MAESSQSPAYLPDLPITPEVDLQEVALRKGIEYLLVSYVPLNNDSRVTVIPVSALRDVQVGGCGVPGAMYYDAHGAEPELMLVPDPDSLIQLPWKREIGWLSSNLYQFGRPYPQCARGALIRQIVRASSAGFSMKCGFEPEFILLDADGENFGDEKDARQPMCLQESLATLRNLPFLQELHRYMQEIGMNPYQLEHEASCCQFELNYDYFDALKAADYFCFLKFMVKEIAELKGRTATFMPLPRTDLLCANGLHVNVSLWRDGTNLFPESESKQEVSELCRNFVAGCLEHVRATAAVMCPSVNSYKRLNRHAWCPNTVTWGHNNRTVLLRMSNNSRMEHRLPDASSNPYLVEACILAAGLDGIERRLDPGEPRFDQVHADSETSLLPENLAEALRLLDESEYVKRELGRPLVTGFVKLRADEWRQYHAQVGNWERRFYLNC